MVAILKVVSCFFIFLGCVIVSLVVHSFFNRFCFSEFAQKHRNSLMCILIGGYYCDNTHLVCCQMSSH